MTQLEIAKGIIDKCYWKNVAFSAETLLTEINNKEFARTVFSAIFQNSTFMMRDLALLNKEYTIEFIKEKEKKLKKSDFNYKYFKKRLDCLINLYIDPSHEVRSKDWNF